MPVLSSTWDGLNPALLASFYEVDKAGVPVGDIIVQAPLTESNIDITLGWQSPFENTGPESMKPTAFAMLQSGELQNGVDAAGNLASKHLGVSNDTVQKAKDVVKEAEGRTGLTKLNSIQTFANMPPVKIQVTALFRAWFNAYTEVEMPVDQLVSWSLPVELAQDGALVNTLKAINGDMEWNKALLPSKSPVLVGMTYKNRTYAPLVIENIGLPIGSPVVSDGRYAEMLIPMTLCTLSALDRTDYLKIIGAAA